MAKGQSPTGSVTIGMFVFAGLWLTSTVILIILYTGQEELRNRTAQVEEFNAKLVNRAQKNSVPLFQQARAGGPTVVGLLEDARKETVRLATGDETDDTAAVRTKLDQQLATIRDDGLVTDADRWVDLSYGEALASLYEAFKAEHALRTDAQQRVAELASNADSLAAAVATQRDDFDKLAKELREKFAEEEQERARIRKEQQNHVAGITREFEDQRRERDAELTGERQKTAELQKRVTQLQQRTAALRAELGDKLIGPKKLATARQPDGHILSRQPNDDYVFIDLGRGDRLVLGLEFAVYPADGGIPPDGRAKARISVVSIDPITAVCQILHIVPGQVIMNGDLIANPVYDRKRPVRFMVLGEFDLDRDGAVDPYGRAVIESKVVDWGGTLVSEITAETDFVVLGRAPRRPRPTNGSGELTPVQRQRQEAYDVYLKTIELANSLAIPILRQDVFLNFLGYGPRQPLR